MAKAKPKRRILIQGAIVAFIVVFGWIGVLVGLQLLSNKGYGFRTETQETLEMIRDGKADQLFEASSPRFREAMVEDRFLDMAARINQTLGGFKKIVSINATEHTSTAEGKTGRVMVSLEFENGRTTGSFSYHWYDGRWRLYGIFIEIPVHLQTSMASPQATKARREAPSEVIAMLTTILERTRDGDEAAIYAESSRFFKQSVSFEKFQALIAKRRERLGRFVRVLQLNKTAQDDDKTKAFVSAFVEFTKRKTIATVDFIKDGGEWKMTRFNVPVPEPIVPRRPPIE